MPEPMKPVENPVLVDAMATFKLDLKNKEHELAFLKAAVEARYLLPAQIEQQPEGEQTEDGKTKARIAFQIMTNQKGEQFMPVYTDEVELRKARNIRPGEALQIAVLPFMEIYHFVKGNENIRGVVINPAGSALCLIRPQVIAIGDNGGTLENMVMRVPASPEQQAAAAAAQAESNRAAQQAAQQAAIRQAMADMEAAKAAAGDETAPDAEEVITDDLIGALKACLKKQKAVKKAYIQPEKEKGEQYLLIALEADAGADLDEIGAAVAKDCADYSDLPFDCVAASSIRAKELVANEKPFYEKKRFGIF